jgi:class 3 adenylate cyclase
MAPGVLISLSDGRRSTDDGRRSPRYAFSVEPVVVTTSVDLGASPKDVWPLLTDTDRMNRIIGGEPVKYRPTDAAMGTPARFLAETRAGGFPVTYEEYPFEWTYERRFNVYRKMHSGVLTAYAMNVDLDPRPDGGSRVTFHLELVPRTFWLKPIVLLKAKKFIENCAALAHAIDEHVVDHAPSPYLKPVSEADAHRLDFARREMIRAGAEEAVAERLCEHVRSAPDSDLVRIRPFDLADELKIPRRTMLRGLLRAVPAGLVELRWSIICPSCRTASEDRAALDEIGPEGHCQLCDIAFDIELDRAVEATFSVHPSVRRVPQQFFCMGGPARTPHVLVQANFEAGGVREVAVPDEPGRYRLFVRGGMTAAIEVVDPLEGGAPETAHAEVQENQIVPSDIVVASKSPIWIKNTTREARHVKIERLGYASTAATAHQVSTLGDFRHLFSSDLLKRGSTMKVARVAILFSDLTGSTALYSAVGDAAAFRLVDDHFDVLRDVISSHEGTIVKTMGDAIMAAFVEPKNALAAAARMLSAFDEFRAGREFGDRIGLKVGVFSGPCYVVTANGALDYFGQTVNVASRVQHLAESGELIVEEWELGSSGASLGLHYEPFEARVKGVEHPLKLVRARLAPASADVSAPRVRAAGGRDVRDASG